MLDSAVESSTRPDAPASPSAHLKKPLSHLGDPHAPQLDTPSVSQAPTPRQYTLASLGAPENGRKTVWEAETPLKARISDFFARETLAPRTNSLAPETVGGSSKNEFGHLGTWLLQHQVNSYELQLVERLLWTE